MSIKRIQDYEDCTVFKPGEIWQSPRGTFYRVLSNEVGGQATLRRVADADGTPPSSCGLRYVRWNEVKIRWHAAVNWVRVRAAELQEGQADG